MEGSTLDIHKLLSPSIALLSQLSAPVWRGVLSPLLSSYNYYTWPRPLPEVYCTVFASAATAADDVQENTCLLTSDFQEQGINNTTENNKQTKNMWVTVSSLYENQRFSSDKHAHLYDYDILVLTVSRLTYRDSAGYIMSV